MAFGDVCLVLGGGGARGLAHLGVLQVFEREDIPVNCIVGTSVGAVVGACYAVCPDALGESRRALAYFKSPSFSGNAFKKVLLKSPDVEVGFLGNLVASIRKSYIFSNLLRKPSIFPGERLYEVIADLVPDKDFKDCQIPFAVPALDIQTGDEILITEGSLRQAVYASCSLPGFFPPVEHQGRLLADAGVIGPVPVRAAKALFQPSVTVAVDITSRLEPLEELGCGLDVLLRVETIAGSRLNALELEKADIVVQPNVGQKYWSDFSGLEHLVNEGIISAEQQVEAVRDLIHRSRRRSIFRKPQAT
ncbi:MAG TPA: patatin-like phospholipase family protein [Planctomycetota bacterium]|nr:patatin-like phospholipase family protein [Planctomycetota bacterium]